MLFHQTCDIFITPMLLYRDNFAMPSPPENWALEFRQEAEDAFTKVSAGPRLRKAVAALMKHPGYREAHGTDDHFMAALFAAGLCGEMDDERRGTRGVLGAEDWELTNMANSQFTLGAWRGGVLSGEID
jgi:aromatic ring-opening dioxygenase catalytic subunit (LigB family)